MVNNTRLRVDKRTSAQKAADRLRPGRPAVHGFASGSMAPEYKAWTGMRYRCSKSTATKYELWGGRGITICDRWRLFENFYADMGPKPGPEYSLDRIDNNGNYTPENCRWADRVTQRRNQRRYRAGQ